MMNSSRSLSGQIFEIIILGFAIWGRSLCCVCCAENTPPNEVNGTRWTTSMDRSYSSKATGHLE